MFNSLYRKLSAILFLILLAVGIALFFVIRYATAMFQEEVAQKLNYDLATHISGEDSLLNENTINQKALENIFHMLMVINPSIELYLLDRQGNVMAFSAPKDHVKRFQVDVAPIKRFLNKNFRYPLYGDDPRNQQTQKIFSAAPIVVNGLEQGYLYVILQSETMDTVVDMIQQSYIARYSFFGLVFVLVLALTSGMILIAVPTKRLSRLSKVMRNYVENRQEGNRYPEAKTGRDEIDLLGRHFNLMANKLDAQLNELAANDSKRRELVASVSHDLRTPLTSLYGYLETLALKSATLTEAEKQHYLHIATEQTKRLTHLVTELFELARLDSVETLITIEPFSLAELAQDVVQKFALRCENKTIKLSVDFGRDLPFAYGDIALMQRVLENLMDNAIRHTSRGGAITLSLTEEKGNIRVSLSDTGIGIPEEELPHIFERFYHRDRVSSEDSKGTGLGLAIAKRILNLHGSAIEAESQVNVGTTFRFAMPSQDR